jgi:hypothetical protein
MENFSKSILHTNLEEWSKENILTLKTTLQQCLPFIRYFHISNTELFDKIFTYKQILNKQLCKDIIQHLAAPDRPVKSIILPVRSALVTELPTCAKEYFSIIISEEHAAEISTWIDRKIINYSIKNIPYKFELILWEQEMGLFQKHFGIFAIVMKKQLWWWQKLQSFSLR